MNVPKMMSFDEYNRTGSWRDFVKYHNIKNMSNWDDFYRNMDQSDWTLLTVS